MFKKYNLGTIILVCAAIGAAAAALYFFLGRRDLRIDEESSEDEGYDDFDDDREIDLTGRRYVNLGGNVEDQDDMPADDSTEDTTDLAREDGIAPMDSSATDNGTPLSEEKFFDDTKVAAEA